MATKNHIYNITELADKWVQGTISKEEQVYFEKWYSEFNDEEVLLSESKYKTSSELRGSILNAINLKIGRRSTKGKVSKLWYKIAVAAVVLISLSAALFFYINSSFIPSPSQRFAKHDIRPGSNKAILTLVNGETINLSDAASGNLVNQSGVSITKTKDGQLIYTANSKSVSSTISTPRGGQFQLTLPDSTHVWLNAASSIKFPSTFAHLSYREVELNGEAYFEVTKNKHQPFRVVTGKQQIEVLGTHFNIKGYADEKSIKTTLLEGSVRVVTLDSRKNGVILKPNEQSVLTSGRFTVQEVSTEEAVAWKNGLFMFSGQNLEGIMKQAARWYDVDVVFEDNNLKKETFKGTISRFKNISQLLEVLESTGSVHFKMEGRRVTAIK